MGISRSVSMALAYIMLEKKWTFIKTLHVIQKKRDIAYPNRSFRMQLRLLQQYYPNHHDAKKCVICIKRNKEKAYEKVVQKTSYSQKEYDRVSKCVKKCL
jgi:hypothetical protein